MLLFQHITGTEGQAWSSRLTRHPREEGAGLPLAAAALWLSTSPRQSSLRALWLCLSSSCDEPPMPWTCLPSAHVEIPVTAGLGKSCKRVLVSHSVPFSVTCAGSFSSRNYAGFVFSPACPSFSPCVPGTARKLIPQLPSAQGHQGGSVHSKTRLSEEETREKAKSPKKPSLKLYFITHIFKFVTLVIVS